MITSTIHVLILVPVFFVMMKKRALRKGSLHPRTQADMTALSKTQPQLL
jgi:copper/silver efflux system protein